MSFSPARCVLCFLKRAPPPPPPLPFPLRVAVNRCCSVHVSEAASTLCLLSSGSDLSWPRASSAPTADRFTSWKTSNDFRLIQFPGHRSLHFFVRVCRNVLKTPSTEVAMEMVTLHTIKEWQSQQWASIHQSGHQTYHWTICQPPPTPGWSPAATSQEEALSWGLMC